MPKMNKRIVEGLAVSQLNDVENYVHDVFRCAAESFPEGMKYLGGRRCTPLEQFREITRALNPTCRFDLLRSDVYLMKYSFSFNGVELSPRYIFLPFVSDGGLIHLRGTQYKITPVLGGKVFNIEKGNIYMPTPRLRMGFNKTPTTCILNGRILNTSSVTSRLHNMKTPERSVLQPILLHYMLAEYGLYTTMKDFFKVDIKFGKGELDKLDPAEWMVYRSRQLPIITRKIETNEVTELRIAIHKDQ